MKPTIDALESRDLHPGCDRLPECDTLGHPVDSDWFSGASNCWSMRSSSSAEIQNLNGCFCAASKKRKRREAESHVLFVYTQCAQRFNSVVKILIDRDKSFRNGSIY